MAHLCGIWELGRDWSRKGSGVSSTQGALRGVKQAWVAKGPLGASVAGAPEEEDRDRAGGSGLQRKVGTAPARGVRSCPRCPQQGGGGGAGCQPRGCRVHSTGSSGLSVACSCSP